MQSFRDTQILLVEDDALIGLATKKNLERMGYKIFHTQTAEKALRIVEENEKITLVLMDIDLGSHTDGIETAKKILERRDLPIVFVSSHVESEIVSATEQITSYGYIVKTSDSVVYDASIKMAYKLFTEKKQKEIYSTYIQTTLDNVSEPLFICDTQGNIVFFNKAYLAIQGLRDRTLVKMKFQDYCKEIAVYSDTGERLNEHDWASTRPLRGIKGEKVVFYVYNHSIKKVLVNYYSYAPIYEQTNKTIIGSYVRIGPPVETPDVAIIKKIKQEWEEG